MEMQRIFLGPIRGVKHAEKAHVTTLAFACNLLLSAQWDTLKSGITRCTSNIALHSKVYFFFALFDQFFLVLLN